MTSPWMRHWFESWIEPLRTTRSPKISIELLQSKLPWLSTISPSMASAVMLREETLRVPLADTRAPLSFFCETTRAYFA